ncbi:MAG: twitching motility protein PilT, twitching motility protein PilT [Candidatus Peregrinibacteria bacterium GW2011_GWC2_39_14]|nr:MAG: Twitching motility protein PilT [Candidatus Peregrinibacteria bacterium GW2011_GWA2_38_36]KKR04377.1 MAG: twitching motility protein PilT, twitching motility protein PilT [Candidatus Peregrinibacteria bacterium GW2011_GWC2_39_14]
MATQLDKIFRTAVQYKASDVFITSGCKPILRINGDLVAIEEHAIITKKTAESYLLEIMNDEQKQTFAKTLDIDFALDIEDIARFRANIFVQKNGIGAVFRVISSTVYSLDELGHPQQLKKILNYKNGLVIVTGPAGSGKSTTMAAVINEFNEKHSKHILTVEDPIEFIFENKKSIIDQREIGTHTHSFAKALKAAMRENADVIMIGEMRNLETIQMALTAAETGHLVIATLHTSGAAKSVDRIIDVFPADQQNQIRSMLSEALKAVIWQSLIKTKDKKGRVAALEIMFVNNGISNLIRKGQTHQIISMLETGMNDGMQTMKKAVLDLLQAGVITEEDAIANIPPEFEA